MAWTAVSKATTTWTDTYVPPAPVGDGWGTAAWGSSAWGGGSGTKTVWTDISKQTTVWT